MKSAIGPSSEPRRTRYFRVISKRYEKGLINLTSNKSFSEWGQIFGDDCLVTAILDRLLHHCDVISTTGPSHRPAHRRRAPGQ